MNLEHQHSRGQAQGNNDTFRHFYDRISREVHTKYPQNLKNQIDSAMYAELFLVAALCSRLYIFQQFPSQDPFKCIKGYQFYFGDIFRSFIPYKINSCLTLLSNNHYHLFSPSHLLLSSNNFQINTNLCSNELKKFIILVFSSIATLISSKVLSADKLGSNFVESSSIIGSRTQILLFTGFFSFKMGIKINNLDLINIKSLNLSFFSLFKWDKLPGFGWKAKFAGSGFVDFNKIMSFQDLRNRIFQFLCHRIRITRSWLMSSFGWRSFFELKQGLKLNYYEIQINPSKKLEFKSRFEHWALGFFNFSPYKSLSFVLLQTFLSKFHQIKEVISKKQWIFKILNSIHLCLHSNRSFFVYKMQIFKIYGQFLTKLDIQQCPFAFQINRRNQTSGWERANSGRVSNSSILQGQIRLPTWNYYHSIYHLASSLFYQSKKLTVFLMLPTHVIFLIILYFCFLPVMFILTFLIIYKSFLYVFS